LRPPRISPALAVSITACLLALAPVAHAVPRLNQVGTFDTPVYVTGAPGDKHRLYVVERAGRVRLIKDGTLALAPFLDISADVDGSGAGGLLSIAFPPDYGTSGLFYAYYTDASGIRVVEFRRSASRDHADPTSERVLLTQPHSVARDHYAGQLQFDSDGLLYVTIGDGGDGGGHAQDLGSLWGKLLRVRPLAASAPYAIPADNPFPSGPRPEIWSYGFRNPWRFSFDHQSGDLVIGDVGQARADEVDFASHAGGRGRGLNFGWNCFEGFQPYGGAPESCSTSPPQNHTPPLFERPLPELAIGGWCRYSITGGYVVRDKNLPSLKGRYIYGDFCSGEIRSVSLTNAATDAATGLSLPDLTLVSFGEDATGRVYLVSIAGPVYRIEEKAGRKQNA
jgi:Glucose / Sorbosone dehydrogenase